MNLACQGLEGKAEWLDGGEAVQPWPTPRVLTAGAPGAAPSSLLLGGESPLLQSNKAGAHQGAGVRQSPCRNQAWAWGSQGWKLLEGSRGRQQRRVV